MMWYSATIPDMMSFPNRTMCLAVRLLHYRKADEAETLKPVGLQFTFDKSSLHLNVQFEQR